MRRSRHLRLVRVDVLLLLVVMMMMQGLLHLLLVLVTTVRAIVLRSSSQCQSGPMLFGGEAVIMLLAMPTLVLLALCLAFQL